jgi:hypothetical protein
MEEKKVMIRLKPIIDPGTEKLVCSICGTPLLVVEDEILGENTDDDHGDIEITYIHP